MSTESKIREEIAGKANDFFERQSNALAEYEQWGDLFKVKAPARKSNTFSNPRQTEFLRAATAVGTMTYRMMTAADPFFTISPVDSHVDYTQLSTVSHVLRTQLKFARYRENLLRACHYAPVFGSVICQEDYRVVGVSAFGRKLPVTVLLPRSLDQVYFDRATLNIHDADYLGTADITSDAELMRLAHEAKTIDAPWNPKALEAACKDKETKNTINWQVLNRINRAGFSTDDALNSKKKELLMYYGKLDCMNDGIEYVAALINRKYLVRFHANNFQHGRRPFRVAKWIDFDGAMGLGYGHLLARTHAAMDANRQKVQDHGSWGAYGMFKRKKGSVDNQNMLIGPLRTIDVESMDDLQSFGPDPRGADNLMNLDTVLKQEFRSAAMAGDTLQAMATSATATSAALSQDQNVRGLSVIAERNSETLCREHIENNHANNCQNIKAPFNINKAGLRPLFTRRTFAWTWKWKQRRSPTRIISPSA
jgi:hypothetical protein